jgi:hypothetical protein
MVFEPCHFLPTVQENQPRQDRLREMHRSFDCMPRHSDRQLGATSSAIPILAGYRHFLVSGRALAPGSCSTHNFCSTHRRLAPSFRSQTQDTPRNATVRDQSGAV